MKQIDKDLSVLSSATPAVSWAETALGNCTAQAEILQDTLKYTLLEAGDGKEQEIWKIC
jgi:hypothetical protein